MNYNYGTCGRCKNWKQYKRSEEFGNCKIIKEQTQHDEFCNEFEVEELLANGLKFDENGDLIKINTK